MLLYILICCLICSLFLLNVQRYLLLKEVRKQKQIEEEVARTKKTYYENLMRV